MANCISGLISNILRDYVNPLEGNQVSVSLWNGNAEIRNLSLKSTALINAGSPLGVINGTIANFKLHYPWGIRDIQPTSIKISDINIEAEFVEDLKLKRIQNRERESKKEQENNKENGQPHNTSFLGRFFTSISDNVNKKIVSNLVVEINHFNFLVHMKTENLKEDVLITMHFDNLRLNMQNENSFFAVDGLLFSISSENEKNSKLNMKFEMKTFTADTNKTTSDIILNQTLFLVDINAFAISDVFVTIQNSEWYQNNHTNHDRPSENHPKKDPNNTFLAKYSLSEMKVNVYDNNIDLNVDINGKCDMSGNRGNLEINKFDIYLTEDGHQYPYIFHDMIIRIRKEDTNVYFNFNHFKPSFSYSDIIDLTNFYHKREKLISFYTEKRKDLEKSDEEDDQPVDKKKKHHHKHHHKKHHNKKSKNKDKVDSDDEYETEENYYADSDEKNQTQKQTWHLDPFEFQFLVYENNRTTIVPYPFFRIRSQVPNLTAIFDDESIIPIPSFECDIFNKHTQKWDVIMEPVSMKVNLKNKNSYNAIFENPINLVCSLQSLIQINQFSHKRLKYDSKDIYPHYFIENNTSDICTVKNDSHLNKIDPYQTNELIFKKTFEINNFTIDPLNFFSPSFIDDHVAVSIFSKGEKKIISVNSPIQVKNKSSMTLYFQNSKGEIAKIRPNGITSLSIYTPSFLINGSEELNQSNLIQFKDIKEQKKILIGVSVQDILYNLFLSYKFSKKKGIFMLLLLPHYKIVNELHIPIKFFVPKTDTNLELNGQSYGFINDMNQEDQIQCIIEMNQTKSEEFNIDTKNQNLIPIKFPNNQMLSIFYDDYIILIKPPMTLKNQTQFPITIYDSSDQSAIEAKAEDDIPFGTSDYFNSDKIKMSLKIENYMKTDQFELRDGRREFWLKSESKKNILYPIVFANYLGPNGVFHIIVDSLVKIKNKTKKLINIIPLDQSGNQCFDSISVKPSEICPITKMDKSFNFSVSFDNSSKPHIVSFKFNSENKIIEEDNSKIEVQTRIKFSLTSYYVIFKELDEKDEIKKQKDNKQAETYSLTVQVPRFFITVLDEKMREIFNFAFNKILYHYDPGNTEEVFNGTINDFQIDDMYPSTKMKKVVYTAVHPFVSVKIHKDATDSTKSICDVQINQIIFNFDFNFVSNVLSEMTKLYKTEPENNDSQEQEDAYDPSYSSLNNDNEKIDYYVAPENDYYIIVQQMNIKPFSFGINFTQNLRPVFHDFEFGSIPYLNSTYNFVFKFNLFSISNLNATIDELMNIFVESYNAAFLLSFFNSLPLNPSNILKGFNYLQEKGGVVTIDFNQVQYENIFNSFEKQITFNISKEAQNNNIEYSWMRFPRSLNYGNQIIPYDEGASLCQFEFQKQINCFDEYFTLFIKTSKKIYALSQFYFTDFNKENFDGQAHCKLNKFRLLDEVKSAGINGKTLTLNFYDSSDEKIICENNEIAINAHKVISNRLNTCIRNEGK